MFFAGNVIMFFAMFPWLLWGALYYSSKKPRTRHKIKAKVVKYHVKGGRYKPVIEFEYKGELIRCETDYITRKKDLPIDSMIDVSYCEDIIGRRYISFGNVYYSGIVQVEIPRIREENERFERNFENAVLAIAIIITLLALLFSIIGIVSFFINI